MQNIKHEYGEGNTIIGIGFLLRLDVSYMCITIAIRLESMSF